MSTFKHNKGKLVEQPEKLSSDFVKVGSTDHEWFDGAAFLEYRASLRTYDAEGNFLEDELVEEKDLEFIMQIKVLGNWYDTKIYNSIENKYIRIIARRKITKEEWEKPEAMNQLDLQTFKDAYIERNDAYNKAIQEIERLKGLIEIAHARGWNDAIGKKVTWSDTSLNKFKSENNL